MYLPSSIRRLAEKASRHLKFTSRLPGRVGSLRLAVSPGASLIYGHPRGLNVANFNDLYDFAEHYVGVGDSVWDVGANMGVFSFAAAFRAGVTGKVLAMEPDIWSVGLLRESCRLNSRAAMAPVEVLPSAIGAEAGIGVLQIPERSRAASHLASAGGAGDEIVGGIRETQSIPVLALDSILEWRSAPQVIKIDVDGGEVDVLEGAKRLLALHQPILLLEVYERNADRVTATLHKLGYTLYDYTQGEAGKRPVERAVYNNLCIPLAKK